MNKMRCKKMKYYCCDCDVTVCYNAHYCHRSSTKHKEVVRRKHLNKLLDGMCESAVKCLPEISSELLNFLNAIQTVACR